MRPVLAFSAGRAMSSGPKTRHLSLSARFPNRGPRLLGLAELPDCWGASLAVLQAVAARLHHPRTTTKKKPRPAHSSFGETAFPSKMDH